MPEPKKKIKVLVCDDHAISRAGLAGVLEAEPDITVVGEAIDGQDAIHKAAELCPDVIIMDLLMPRCDGMEATISIKQRFRDMKIIILTISEREEHLFQALRFGADGYLSKDSSIVEIVQAVRGVAEGKVMLSPPFATRLVAGLREDSHQPSISKREMQVLQLLGEGLTNVEIAERLFISESTVRTYLRRLLEKLHLRNRSEAVVYALHHHFNHIEKKST